MSEDKNTKTKTNVVGIGHNDANAYSKEQYEKLLSRFHWMMDYAGTAIHHMEHLFDEAFTGYRDPKSFSKQKLKPFEVHERRHRALAESNRLIENLSEEIKKAEAKAKAYGLKLEKVEECKAAQEECDRINAKHKEEDEGISS